jgi:hypothetical protein
MIKKDQNLNKMMKWMSLIKNKNKNITKKRVN